MTQEDKDLLLKDLCARLPYGVKVNADYINFNRDGKLFSINNNEELILSPENGYSFDVAIEKCKPYLFPLSSMTEEQKDYIRNRFCYDWDGEPYEIWRYKIDIEDAENLVDLFNKNHLDYRCLIPKGLANDATGLNIY